MLGFQHFSLASFAFHIHGVHGIKLKHHLDTEVDLFHWYRCYVPQDFPANEIMVDNLERISLMFLVVLQWLNGRTTMTMMHTKAVGRNGQLLCRCFCNIWGVLNLVYEDRRRGTIIEVKGERWSRGGEDNKNMVVRRKDEQKWEGKEVEKEEQKKKRERKQNKTNSMFNWVHLWSQHKS